ncbi:MAG: phosphodiester glycosidase family protein [Anaeromicrobium sp.]|jgi:hypothetical protein|uniref:phosphodiester glycosidase family protein n=1 Tax=Anaeromicrobium sp. TaxID=1929132 RepID=UPI0025FBC6E9|nr:phosphodiester glycosidase family protein [Anaeromicrobium sp.]MCT4595225.1 phosphodiester glycosidase family protein [Anaeromicrobium sp.]
MAYLKLSNPTTNSCDFEVQLSNPFNATYYRGLRITGTNYGSPTSNVGSYVEHRSAGGSSSKYVVGIVNDGMNVGRTYTLYAYVQQAAAPYTWWLAGSATITMRKSEVEYEKIASTHVVRLDPKDLRISHQNKRGSEIALYNFVTAGYQWTAKEMPLSIAVSEGKVLVNRQPHYGANGYLPAGTLIVYNDGSVDVKPVADITKEKDVYFAVGGCTIMPNIRMEEEGFKGMYSDIGRKANRPVIGYNPKTNKVIIAVRPDSDIARGQKTLINLGCTKGITLDGGGSAMLKVDGKYKMSTSRKLVNVITW